MIEIILPLCGLMKMIQLRNNLKSIPILSPNFLITGHNLIITCTTRRPILISHNVCATCGVRNITCIKTTCGGICFSKPEVISPTLEYFALQLVTT